MSNDKSKAGKVPPSGPGGPGGPTGPTTPPGQSGPPPKPVLFRRVDWITFAVTTLIVFVGYCLTLAPDLGLEDSGELAVGSYYAGVPHPPGYPVWTLYTWLFTHIPFSNVAWRVSLSSAVAGALACGLLALMVSRGSSLLLEGIADFKDLERRLEGAICFVSGFVAGALLGFNGIPWSQAVIVEVYTFSVLSYMAVLVCLFRWIYAPQQRKYLYWTFFWFGICFTNHQTLIVAAIGLEIAVAAASPKLGRDMFIGNSLVYVLGLLAKSMGVLTTFDSNFMLFVVYNLVGISSLGAAAYMIASVGLPKFELRGGWLPWSREWTPVLICLGLWVLGASFYFYMPLASMTNPPLNWGYPRTEEGFFHALTRGQYDKTNPTDSIFKLFGQIAMYHEVAIDEFSLVYLLIGIVPFLFWPRMQKRERAWLTGLISMYLLLSVLLLVLLNPSVDKQSRDQTRVFFIPAHIVLALLIGYGVTLISGVAAVTYERNRRWLVWGGAILTGLQLYLTVKTFENTLFTMLRAAEVMCLLTTACFTLVCVLYRKRVPVAILIGLFALAPIRSALSNWSDAEQRGHLFGFWFGHDMFTPPFGIYPEMTRNAILFGGTDPGRFCPTYMIFCESFIPPRCRRDPTFDRRDVYIITQNALADHTYLNYIRAHYNRSTEHDPYFFSELVRSERETREGRTNLLSKMLLPVDRFFTALGERIEKRRRDQGVYPPKEINTPSPEESQKAFQDYIMDAQRRLQANQLRPGEDVKIVDDRVQVAGQTAVMAINGLLTKVIFDRNPENEFYVEESFPLDWMFPHLTPYGIIMKINRDQVPRITEEMMQQDHDFWSRYSERLIGNWITYDTPLSDICAFAERVYLRRDFTGFKGDRKFVRDGVAQKSFSKLRSAIGGLYGWRLSQDCPPDLRPKTAVEQQRLLKETEFALRQAYAYCPYSPEAVYKLMNLLMGSGRVDEAIQVTETSLKFDPSNPVFQNLVNQLRSMRPAGGAGRAAIAPPAPAPFAELEERFRSNSADSQVGMELIAAYRQIQRTDKVTEVLDMLASNPHTDVPALLSVAQAYAEMGSRVKVDSVLQKLKGKQAALLEQFSTNSNNIPVAFQLVSIYLITQQTNAAVQLLDQLAERPNADPSTLLSAAQAYAQLLDAPKLERTLQKLAVAVPDSPEAWYDLATVQATMGKNPQAMQSLRKALQLNQHRLTNQPGSKDLRPVAAADVHFSPFRAIPEFQRLTKTN
ncbi:MAG: DUF2723 domain-containing protein [Verrucomicrobiota bacterium]